MHPCIIILYIIILYIIGMGISHSLFNRLSKVYREGSQEVERGAVVMMWLMFWPIVWLFLIPSMIVEYFYN